MDSCWLTGVSSCAGLVSSACFCECASLAGCSAAAGWGDILCVAAGWTRTKQTHPKLVNTASRVREVECILKTHLHHGLLLCQVFDILLSSFFDFHELLFQLPRLPLFLLFFLLFSILLKLSKAQTITALIVKYCSTGQADICCLILP